MSWALYFKSRTGNNYSVEIGGGGSAVTTITGASNPVVINEDDSTDIFAGVKTSSGYINIIDEDGSTWRSIAPTNSFSRPVVIKRGTTTVWRGFLKPETYGCEYLGQPQVLRLPVVCPLTVLQSTELTTNPSTGINPTFSELFDAIITDVETLAGWNTPITRNIPNGQSFNTLFYSVVVQWGNLMDINDEGNYVPKYNNLELLEHICTFLGVTCRYGYGGLYFCMPDDTNTNYIGSISYPTIDFSGGFPTADNRGTDEIVQGCRRAVVKSDINPLSQLLSAPLDKILESNINKSITTTTYNEFGRKYKKNGVGSDYTFGMLRAMVSGGATFDILQYIDNVSGIGEIVHDWTTQVYFDNINSTAVFSNSQSVLLSNGKIKISGSVFKDVITDGKHSHKVGNGYMKAKFRIGNSYWTGYGWSHNPPEVPWFIMDVSNGTIGKTNITYTSTGERFYSFEASYFIPVSSVTGDIELTIFNVLIAGTPDTTYVSGQSMNSIYINYSRGNERSLTENVFRINSGSQFEQSVDKDSIFASDGVLTAYGLGLVAYDGKYLTPEVINDVPEERLATRIATWGMTTRRVLTLELLNGTSLDSVTPYHIIRAPDGNNYHPLSIGHNFWDDTTTLKLIKL